MTRVPSVSQDSETERKILDAARNVFIRRGTAGARMQEIAEEAGVNQALLHYYFRTKERLAATVFRESAARLLPAVMGVFSSNAPLEKKIEQFVHVYIDTVRRSPFLPGYVVSEMHHHPERLRAMLDSAGVDAAPIVDGLLKKLASELSVLADRGEIRPIPADQFLLNVIGLVVIPFVARPALGFVLGLDDAQFNKLLDERRVMLPALILNSLRP